jgi:peptidoglycan hydrolase-like protein with peptidoglycan-binding domain
MALTVGVPDPAAALALRAKLQQPAAPATQPAATDQSGENFFSKFNGTMSKPDNKSFADVGEDGKRVQSLMYNAGMYPAGSSYGSEVDGKFGPKTAQATKDTQTLLKKAGYYNGPINGQFNAGMAQGLEKLKSAETMPSGLSADETQKLTRMGLSAAQAKPAQLPVSQDASTFTAAAKAGPVNLNGGAAAAAQPVELDVTRPEADKAVNTTLTTLGMKVDTTTLPQGPAAQQAAKEQMAKMADTLAASPNTLQALKTIGQQRLGFDPNDPKFNEQNVDKFLHDLSSMLRGQRPDQVAPAAPAAPAVRPAPLRRDPDITTA